MCSVLNLTLRIQQSFQVAAPIRSKEYLLIDQVYSCWWGWSLKSMVLEWYFLIFLMARQQQSFNVYRHLSDHSIAFIAFPQSRVKYLIGSIISMENRCIRGFEVDDQGCPWALCDNEKRVPLCDRPSVLVRSLWIHCHSCSYGCLVPCFGGWNGSWSEAIGHLRIEGPSQSRESIKVQGTNRIRCMLIEALCCSSCRLSEEEAVCDSGGWLHPRPERQRVQSGEWLCIGTQTRCKIVFICSSTDFSQRTCSISSNRGATSNRQRCIGPYSTGRRLQIDWHLRKVPAARVRPSWQWSETGWGARRQASANHRKHHVKCSGKFVLSSLQSRYKPFQFINWHI